MDPRGFAFCLLSVGCIAPGPRSIPAHRAPAFTEFAVSAVGEPVHPAWKQRLDQPYVFLEHAGSYTEVGPLIPVLLREMQAQRLRAAGPPFALFFDDPGVVPSAELRARVCAPVDRPVDAATPLGYDVLPSVTVVYGLVAGPYPEVPRSYPGLFAYLEQQGWALAGPVREIYLVPPASARRPADLIAEVQIPATQAR